VVVVILEREREVKREEVKRKMKNEGGRHFE